MIALLPLLAETDAMISGNWLIAICTLLVAADLCIVQELRKNSAVASARRMSSTLIEGQPISVEVVGKLATKGELADLEARIVAELKKLESSLLSERSVARTANGNLHARIDKTDGCMMEMKGQLHQIVANLNRLVDIAMQHPTPHRKLP